MAGCDPPTKQLTHLSINHERRQLEIGVFQLKKGKTNVCKLARTWYSLRKYDPD